MFSIPLSDDLLRRLRTEAARQGRTPEACARAAVEAWLAECEAAAETARRLGGDPVVRPPDDFWD